MNLCCKNTLYLDKNTNKLPARIEAVEMYRKGYEE
jgi:hypothetical protein